MFSTFQAPKTLLELLEPSTSPDLLLRITSLLVNLVVTKRRLHMDAKDLPPIDKAASPDTMFSALYGHNNMERVRNKVFVLTTYSNVEIRQYAQRIYDKLKI